MKFRFLYVPLLCAMGLTGAEPETTRVKLIDFENFSKLRSAISIPRAASDFGAKIREETAPDRVLGGRASLELTLASAQNHGPRWPQIIFRKNALQERDWRIFHRLVFKIHVLKSSKDRIGVFARGKSKGLVTYYRIKPGEKRELVYNIEKWAPHESAVKDLVFYGIDLKVENRYILDDFELELDHRILTRKIADFQLKLQNCSEQSLVKELKELQKLKPGILQAKRFLALQEKYASWHQKQTEKLRLQQLKAFQTKNHRTDWGYGSASPLTHVFRNLPFAGTIGQPLRISLAKNETEAVQLVLCSTRLVNHVEVQLSPLTGPQGAQLTQLKSYVVGHVKTTPPGYEVLIPNQWRPDPLLDFQKKFTLDPAVFQAVWIDVRTLPNQPAGRYRGTVVVKGDQIPELKVPLEVEVWDFALPKVLTFDTFFNYYCNYLHLVYEKDKKAQKEFRLYYQGGKPYAKLSPQAKRLADIDLQTRKLLLDHHITPDRMYLPVNVSWKLPELKDILAQGGKNFNAVYISHVNGPKMGAHYPAWRKQSYLKYLRKKIPQYRAAGILDRARIYSFDEVTPESYAMAREMIKAVKAEFPQVPQITTLRDYTFGEVSGLRDYIDIWVPVTPKYAEHQKAVQKARQAGKKIWYYTADFPFFPYANLNLEDPASAGRLLVGFMARQQQSDGFLYWHVTSWKPNTKLITRGPLTEHDGASRNVNGSGMLLYPTPQGAIPSMRLKNLRDGLEDYEYTAILRNLNPAKLTSAQRKQRAKLLQVPAKVCTSVKSYDMTGEQVLAYRQQLGEFLNSLQK